VMAMMLAATGGRMGLFVLPPLARGQRSPDMYGSIRHALVKSLSTKSRESTGKDRAKS
jgi:hypothetical protein